MGIGVGFKKRKMKGLIFAFDFLPRHVPRLPKWKLRLWLSPHRSDSTRYNYLRFHLTLNRLAVLWFLAGTPISFTNKTDLHDIDEIVLTVMLNTIAKTLQDTRRYGLRLYSI
jgi:hypothetical protein